MRTVAAVTPECPAGPTAIQSRQHQTPVSIYLGRERWEGEDGLKESNELGGSVGGAPLWRFWILYPLRLIDLT